VRTAVARARAGEGPSLVEVKTYRYSEHSEGLRHAGLYRPDDEHAAWVARDPITRFRAVLEDRHGVDPAALDALDTEVKAEVAEAVRFARESPFPEPAEAFDDLYATRTAPAL
jgi:TPP-dependent pyruvate/acetoin dehydrogenase alpha subunit